MRVAALMLPASGSPNCVWSSSTRLLANLNERTYEAMLARIAWHERAHALSIVRATHDDIAAGERLLALAPVGVAEFVPPRRLPSQRLHP